MISTLRKIATDDTSTTAASRGSLRVVFIREISPRTIEQANTPETVKRNCTAREIPYIPTDFPYLIKREHATRSSSNPELSNVLVSLLSSSIVITNVIPRAVRSLDRT